MAVLSGGGDMGARIRAFDWAATDLGEPAVWPEALRTLVGVMLGSRQPMFTAWGPRRITLYNDSYAEMMGGKHPAGLGEDFLAIWHEARADLEPLMSQVYAGTPIYLDDLELVLDRGGQTGPSHFAFSWTPVRDIDGRVAACFCACTETTAQVLAAEVRAADAVRQRRLFDNAPGFVCILSGPDHVFEFVNAAYNRVFGPRELIGRSIRAAFPDIGGQGYYELLDEVYATGERRVVHRSRVMLDIGDAAGAEMFLDYVYEPVVDEAGVVTGIFCQGSDVTAVHRGELALRATEAELRRLNADLEAQVEARAFERGRMWHLTPDLLGVLDRRGYFIRTNPAWQTLLGWTAAEIAETSIFDLMHPDDVERTRTGFALMSAGETILRFDNRYRAKSGEYLWLAWFGVPEGDEFYCSARDITLETTAAAALEATQARLQGVFASNFQLQAILDLAGRVIDVNPTALTMAGVELASVVGAEFCATPWFATTAGAVEAVRADVETAAAGRACRRELSLDLPAGTRIFDLTVRPICDLHDRIIGIVPEALDITERRHAEEALRQSQKLEAMGQLTGGVAHDFNNLLTPIIGGLDLLQRRGVGNEREQRLIGGAIASAERARVLVQRLLAFARRQPLQSTAVDFGELVENMAELIASTVGPQVELAFAVAPALPPATGETNQLEMALLNLCVNARDAMPGGGRLRIALDVADDDRQRPAGLAGEYLCLSVSDTGSGMDAMTLARAVEPFFSTKGVGKGTGLGLSMVHGLASQLGGALDIDSAPRAGTTVTLWLPVSAASKAVLPTAPPSLAKRHSGRVLLVDDEELVRASTADMLHELGFEVYEAASAGEALGSLDTGLVIDLLITDHLMHGMNGVELARAVRLRQPALPVLIISGFAEADGLAPDLPRLTKPFRASELAEGIAAMAASERRYQLAFGAHPG